MCSIHLHPKKQRTALVLGAVGISLVDMVCLVLSPSCHIDKGNNNLNELFSTAEQRIRKLPNM